MQDVNFKKQLLSEIAKRIVEQWPEEDTTITPDDRSLVCQPLYNALDMSQMNGTLLSWAGSVIDHLREGVVEAIWYLDQLPVVKFNQQPQAPEV